MLTMRRDRTKRRKRAEGPDASIPPAVHLTSAVLQSRLDAPLPIPYAVNWPPAPFLPGPTLGADLWRVYWENRRAVFRLATGPYRVGLESARRQGRVGHGVGTCDDVLNDAAPHCLRSLVHWHDRGRESSPLAYIRHALRSWQSALMDAEVAGRNGGGGQKRKRGRVGHGTGRLPALLLTLDWDGRTNRTGEMVNGHMMVPDPKAIDPAAAAEDRVDRIDLWVVVRPVLRRREYALLVSHFREGLSLAEIGRQTGHTRSRTQQVYRRALDRLRAAVADGLTRGYTP